MTKKKKIILIITGFVLFLTLLAVGVYIYWGLFQCYAYYEVVLSSPDGSANLSGKSSILNPPVDSNAPILSLGYALVGINPGSIDVIKYLSSAKTDLVVSSNECKILFSELWSSDWPTKDTNSIESSGLPSIFAEDPFGYSFGVKAANTMPKGYTEIFFMPRREFLEYLTLAGAKSQNVMNQNGIGIVETPYIRGIVRFGELKKPNLCDVEIFSKESNIRQSVSCGSKDPEKSKDALLSLLASYRFLITEIPDEDALRVLIITELEKHDKFVSE